MLVNGWKGIANHLNCGVRTAQRWHKHLHLPIIRDRKSPRGPVIAESEKLDDWLRHRSSLARLAERTSATLKKTAEEGRNFLRAELLTTREFVRLARASTTRAAANRRRSAARKAYDTTQRLLSRRMSLPELELKRVRTELQELKRDLEQLGEQF